MQRHGPPYPPEFRQRIIELVRPGRTPEELSGEFGPAAQTIRKGGRLHPLTPARDAPARRESEGSEGLR